MVRRHYSLQLPSSEPNSLVSSRVDKLETTTTKPASADAAISDAAMPGSGVTSTLGVSGEAAPASDEAIVDDMETLRSRVAALSDCVRLTQCDGRDEPLAASLGAALAVVQRALEALEHVSARG